MTSEPCRSCGGRGYVETWMPDYMSGGSICTGAVRCLDCDGPKPPRPLVIRNAQDWDQAMTRLVADAVSARER